MVDYIGNAKARRYNELLRNENVQRTLRMIRYAEGTEKYGERTHFGGSRIEGDLKDHPRRMHNFKTKSGKSNKTSAAGAYQFLGKTWDGVKGELDLPDFGRRSQDIAALALLDRRGALSAAVKGDPRTVARKAGGEWASLGHNNYDQPTRSGKNLARAFNAPLSKDVTSMADRTGGGKLTPKSVPTLSVGANEEFKPVTGDGIRKTTPSSSRPQARTQQTTSLQQPRRFGINRINNPALAGGNRRGPDSPIASQLANPYAMFGINSPLFG